MRTELKDLQIIEIIHVEKEIDLVNSMNPDPNFYGWRFYDYKNHRISESFNSSLYARKQLINEKITWRKMSSRNPNPPIQQDHSIAHFSPLNDEELL